MEAEAVDQPADTAGPEVVDDKAKPEEAISTAVTEYSPLIEGLARMRHELKNRVFDLTSVKGNDEARRARKTLVTTRTTLGRRRDELKRELRASVATRIALLDTEADRLIGFVQELEIPIDQMIAADEDRREREKQAREDAERERCAAHRERITAISDVALRAVGLPSAEIQAKIDLVTRVTIDASFEEYEAAAGNSKFETLLRLKELHAAAVASEEQAAQALRDKAELERLQREDRERQEREARERAEQQRVEAEQRRLADEQRAAQQRAEDARRAQSNAANDLVDEIRRIQRRALTASGTGMLELLTLVENIRPGDELGDFVGVAQKAKDDAIADLHELHEQRLAQERQRREDEERTQQARADLEAAQRRIDETAAELRRQQEELEEKQRVAEAAAKPVEPDPPPADEQEAAREAPPLVPFESVQFSGADTQSVELTPAPVDDGLAYLLDVGMDLGVQREVAMYRLLSAVVDVAKAAFPAKKKAPTHWSVPTPEMAALQAALRAIPLPSGGYYAENGTLMNADGKRSVFDDVAE